MALENYDRWLAALLGQRAQDVRLLTTDRTALQFLLAWSMFESKCFGGFATTNKIGPMSERLINNERFAINPIDDVINHFHDRYQDPDRYRHLMHKQRSPKLERIIGTSRNHLTEVQALFFILFVVYRFRNNMFHGNKRIQTWLGYGPQIDMCTRTMQTMVSHEEERTKSMKAEEGAR